MDFWKVQSKVAKPMKKKEFISKNIFFVITKNSNWEILPKNLVTFKRYDGIEDEKLRNPTFRRGMGGFTKNQYRGGRIA